MDSLKIENMRLEQMMPLIRDCLADGRSIHLFPKGTSMLPMLRQGRDYVILSPLPDKLHKYDLPLYQRRNGQYVLHRVITAGETYTCMGDNQSKPEPGLCHDQMIALVTAFSRDNKLYSVDRPAYRLYCRFWHYSRPFRYVWRCGKGFLRRCLK